MSDSTRRRRVRAGSPDSVDGSGGVFGVWIYCRVDGLVVVTSAPLLLDCRASSVAAADGEWQSATVKDAKRPDKQLHRAASRYRTRRDGGTAVALFLLPWVVALVLVRLHRHLDVAAVTVVVAFSVGLPPIWVAWAAYRGPRRSGAHASGLSLAQVADQLAFAVGDQWEAEARSRRLNDPYPLPVSWAAADASLTDSWDSLVKLAASGVGWPCLLACRPGPMGQMAWPGRAASWSKCWPRYRLGGWSCLVSRARARRC